MSVAVISNSDLLGFALGVCAAAFIVMSPTGGSTILLASAGLSACWVIWRDARSFTIPDGAVAALALVGCAARLSGAVARWDVLVSIACDVALTGGVLWLLREAYFRGRGYDGIGFGDVKLAAAAGCLVGAGSFYLALLGASLAGLVLAGFGRSKAADRIAFGALLAPAIWLVLATQTVEPWRLL